MYSVALCTYNGARFIKQQLLSIVGQSTPPAEVVICDDNSTDNTLQIITEIAQSNLQINWIVEKNQSQLGYIRNFEQAIQKCTMPYILLSDQDDTWIETKAETMLSYFNQNPNGQVVFSDGGLMDEEGRKLQGSLFNRLDFVHSTKEELMKRLKNRDLVTGATMGIKKSFVEVICPFPDLVEGSFIHDSYIAMMAALMNSLGVIDQQLIHYRLHDSQAVGFKSPQIQKSKKEELVDILEKHRKRAQVLIEKKEFLPKTEVISLEDQIKYLSLLLMQKHRGIEKLHVISPVLLLKKIPEFSSIRSYVGNVRILLSKDK